MLFDRLVESIIGEDKTNLGNMRDDEGNEWSVNKIIDFVERNKNKYFKKDFPVSELKHELSWWDKQNKENKEKSDRRVTQADTSYPLLVIKDKNYGLSVADGLNRLKKAIDVEHKKTIDIYLIPKEEVPESARVGEDKKLKKDK